MASHDFLLDTCVAIKKIQQDSEGDLTLQFLTNKTQYLSTYSVTEFKNTFVKATIYLDSMIKEGRTLREIYHDINIMKTNSDTKISKLGRRLEILLGILDNPKKINEKILLWLKLWIKDGVLTQYFVGDLCPMDSITFCPMGKIRKGTFSDKFCNEDICKLQDALTKYCREINKIKIRLRHITDNSFLDLIMTLNTENIKKFDKLKCDKIGDIIIGLDYLFFLKNHSKGIFCTSDHHFKEILPTLGINEIFQSNQPNFLKLYTE